MNRNARLLQRLDESHTEPIRDPLWKHIYLSPGLLALLQQEPIQQLRGIKQLGPADLVYPGATHTRLAHSLGVFHLAKGLITHLLRRTPAWQVEQEELDAFLCANLLHDIGHYPYAHSLKDLKLRRHEELTAELIRGQPLADSLKRLAGVNPDLVAAIIDEKSTGVSSRQIVLFRKLLSGVLDPDKLDYLNRDAYHCGVPYGTQDIDFIYDQVALDDDLRFGVTTKGVAAVESVLFSRYLMYRSVYWHKTVRTATAMIKKAVLMGLRDGTVTAETFYGIDDHEFFARIRDQPNYLPFQLITAVQRRKLYQRVLSVPYREANPLHRILQDPADRLDVELGIAREARHAAGREVRPEEVIIDVPEQNHFDTDLVVVDNHQQPSVPFSGSGTVFGPDVVTGFASALRHVSVVAPREPMVAKAVLRAARATLTE